MDVSFVIADIGKQISAISPWLVGSIMFMSGYMIARTGQPLVTAALHFDANSVGIALPLIDSGSGLRGTQRATVLPLRRGDAMAIVRRLGADYSRWCRIDVAGEFVARSRSLALVLVSGRGLADAGGRALLAARLAKVSGDGWRTQTAAAAASVEICPKNLLVRYE